MYFTFLFVFLVPSLPTIAFSHENQCDGGSCSDPSGKTKHAPAMLQKQKVVQEEESVEQEVVDMYYGYYDYVASDDDWYPRGGYGSCEPGYEAISISTVGTNDLGNTNITYNDVLRKYNRRHANDSHSVNLVITADENYKASDAAKNGVNEQGFGIINMMSGTESTLHFRFFDASTNQPVRLTDFYLSFYDVDSYADNRNTEIIKLCSEARNAQMYRAYGPLSLDSVQVTYPQDDPAGCWVAKPGASSGVERVSTETLTNFEMKNAFTLAFMDDYGRSNLTGVDLTFQVETAGKKKGGRNFLFSGRSAACASLNLNEGVINGDFRWDGAAWQTWAGRPAHTTTTTTYNNHDDDYYYVTFNIYGDDDYYLTYND